MLATAIATHEGEWAVATPDGLFDKSENFTGMHWVRGMDIIELDQFFDDFYTPGLLAQVMSGEEIERPDINIADKLRESPPPSVEIISPKVGEKFSKKTVEIQIRITDNGGGIDEVKLLHNGKRVSDDTRGMKKKSTGKSVVRTYNVSLVSGKNEFIASAFSKGRIESRGYKLEVLFQGTAKTASSYILAIGINEYKNKRLNLNYARADATAFTELIEQNSKKLFKNVKVVTLYDREATKESILSALDEIAAEAEPQDVFTFYYAGHGSVVDNRFYFVTSENVRLFDRGMLDANAIWAKELQEKFAQIKALKQLIVMDACQSGAATELLAVRGASEEKAMAQLARSAGVHVLASAGSEQYATEFKELGHGVFTYVFLEALRGKADGAPKDGKVTINELKAYLDDQVPVLTEKYKGEAQYPNTFSKGQDFPVGVVK